MPGTLPQLNKYAVELGVRAALALNCQINQHSMFERKHYYYHDLPLGFQVTQQRYPIGYNGKFQYLYRESNDLKNPLVNSVLTVDRIQIEQDSAKSFHDSDPNYTLVDLNRAGCGLIEIVFAPELNHPEQASGVLKTIQELLRHIHICDGNIEDGSMRCDVNISVNNIENPSIQSNRVEIKNLSSILSVYLASKYEINRQIEVLSNSYNQSTADTNTSSNPIILEKIQTRGYNEIENYTYFMREKELATDYRYFPDPDLPPIVLSNEEIQRITNELPDLPAVTIAKYQQLGLEENEIHVLMSKLGSMKYFDQTLVELQEIIARDSISLEKHPNVAKILFNWLEIL